MKYYVYYVEDCTPKIKQFKTKKDTLKFNNNFFKDPNNGYNIEFIFKGDFISFDGYYKRFKLSQS